MKIQRTDWRRVKGAAAALAVWSAAMVIAFGGAAARADSITLKKQATVSGARVTLKDVAQLEGAAAVELGDEIIWKAGTDAGALGNAAGVRVVTVSTRDISKLLTDKKVHGGKVTVRGFASCEVTLKEGEMGGATSGASASAMATAADVRVETAVGKAVPATKQEATANESDVKDVTGTLRDVVEARIAELAGVKRDGLRFAFTGAAGRELAELIGKERVEFEPLTTVVPGRVMFVIRRYGAGEAVRQIRGTVDVAQRYEAVTARRAIKKGETVGERDVETREIFAGSAKDVPVTVRADVVGKVAKGAIAAGEAILAEALTATTLVKKGELVAVRARVGDLMIRVTGRAKEDGGLGETIQVMNEASHKLMEVLVTGHGETELSVVE